MQLAGKARREAGVESDAASASKAQRRYDVDAAAAVVAMNR
jgi:hypothetical protein